MPQIKFRFTTECELTLDGDSYEEAYLKFKDLIHGEQKFDTQKNLKIFPPEESTIFFEVGNQQEEYSQINQLKGDFKQDILSNCTSTVAAEISKVSYKH